MRFMEIILTHPPRRVPGGMHRTPFWTGIAYGELGMIYCEL